MYPTHQLHNESCFRYDVLIAVLIVHDDRIYCLFLSSCYHLRMINIMAAIISAADIICMGFMAVSQGRWIGYLDSERANLAVTWVQSVVLFGERSR